MNKKSFWSELPKNNILITFVLVLIEFPCVLVDAVIAAIIGEMFGSYVIYRTDYEFEPNFCIALVGFIFHLVLYVFFRFAVKQKIHIPILTALLIVFDVCIPFMTYEFLYSLDINYASIFGGIFTFLDYVTMFGRIFLYQVILFGIFIVTFSMLDRKIGSMMSGLKISVSFVTAVVVGAQVLWCVWMLLM